MDTVAFALTATEAAVKLVTTSLNTTATDIGAAAPLKLSRISVVSERTVGTAVSRYQLQVASGCAERLPAGSVAYTEIVLSPSAETPVIADASAPATGLPFNTQW